MDRYRWVAMHRLVALLLGTIAAHGWSPRLSQPRHSHHGPAHRRPHHDIHHSSPRSITERFGISEWRDLDFDIQLEQLSKPSMVDESTADAGNSSPRDARPMAPAPLPQVLPRSVCVLPFPHEEVLLPGETKQLRLYEDRFLKLFADVRGNHADVLAMGLLAPLTRPDAPGARLISTVLLCEIESCLRAPTPWERPGGAADAGFAAAGTSVFLTVRAVGRARVHDLAQTEPYLRAVCTEIQDRTEELATVDPELPQLLAGRVEELLLWLTSAEDRLRRNQEERRKIGAATDDDDIDDDVDRERRMRLAELEDRFYADGDEGDEEVDDDDADGLNSRLSRRLSRLKRFKTAYTVALETDSQGYHLSAATAPTDGGDVGGRRSPRELTALSWAAFCTGLLPEEDAAYRIQALTTDRLVVRLRLAVHMLRERQRALVQRMQRAGLPVTDWDRRAGE